MNGLHATDAEDVTREMMHGARTGVQSLRAWLGHMEEAMERSSEGAFPILWCETMMERALTVYNEVARANGAVLVRAVGAGGAGGES